MRRIGMLTSDGDCQALNTTMRGVAESLYSMFDDVETIGFEDGYKGLIYADYQIMKSPDFSGTLAQGGAILGAPRQLFKLVRTPDENRLDKVEAMKYIYKKLELSCLVVLGGNGSQKTVSILSEKGLNVVSLPETTNNDLWSTDMTLGSQSVAGVATNTIDCTHTTAAPYGRVFIVEVMGYKVGWLTLYAGLAGGAGIILLPGIPHDINIVCDVLTKRSEVGKRFSILAVAEDATSREDTKMSKKGLKEKKKSGAIYPPVAYETGAKIQKVIGSEVGAMVPGYMQRGDEPYTYNHVLVTRLDAAAARLIAEERYGYMVVVKNNDITRAPLSEAAGRLKTVDPERSMIKEAKMVGISFNDEQLHDDENERQFENRLI